MELYQAIVLAVIQGVTELFPVSSLGHAVVVPHLLGWDIDQESPTFLPFLVMLHLGTALALLVVGTIPAGLLGLIFRNRLESLFSEWRLVAVFLILNGVMLAGGELLRRRAGSAQLAKLRPLQAILIGTSQAIALLPGFSRSGATMVGGLLVGLEHQSAARFSFLLATPIILAAGLI